MKRSGLWPLALLVSASGAQAQDWRAKPNNQPKGSIWHFPQACRNDQHGKLLLMASSYDRSGSVGFRCVADAD